MEKQKLTPELMKQARQTKTPEELQSFAAEHDMECTAEQAKKLFEQLHIGASELSDEELDNVSGGGCGSLSDCPYCGCKEYTYLGPYTVGFEERKCANCHKTYVC